MSPYSFYRHPLHEQLTAHARRMDAPFCHLRHLIQSDDRLARFSLNGGGLFFDYSRQRLDSECMQVLFELAEASGARQRFAAMAAGEKVNVTEQRAAGHMAARSAADDPVMVGKKDVKPDLKAVRQSVGTFAAKVHSGDIKAANQEPFTHVVVVGIGGSYLGTEFVATALSAYADRGMRLFFLANVDIHNFAAIWSQVDPRQTLWVIISKSYTTVETMANADLVSRYLQKEGMDPARQMVTVTSKGSPGDKDDMGLAAFHMFDYIGGRYSVTSAVGALPLSLYLGADRFERFLSGAEEMDHHALSADPQQNLPLVAALLGIWNTSFLGYPQMAIIPYAYPLRKLAAHVQQLNMESNGKSVDLYGRRLDRPSGTVIFGEPGTNAQHSFFQLAHQGPALPIDFIGVRKPQAKMDEGNFKGVGHHQELWANMLAQATALATGRENDDAARAFDGNRPSSVLVLEDLQPESVGRLLAFYEAKTIYEAFIWGINPFDQFGVELGKVTAVRLREEMAARNADAGYQFTGVDPINRFYLDMLFTGERT